MTLVYVVRTFPKLSESFVLREVREHVERGREIVVWSLRPLADAEPASDGADAVADNVRHVPSGWRGALALARSCGLMGIRSPRRFLAACGFAGLWALKERDPRHLAALPYAAYLGVRLPPDAHVHSHFANTPATVGILCARMANRPFSFTGHARDLFVITSPSFLRAKVKRAAFVALGTDFARAEVAQAIGQDLAHKLMTIRNGVEVGEAHRSPSARERASPPLVVSVGRLVQKKGHTTLIDAAAELAARQVELECAIVGDGPDEATLLDRIRERNAPVSLLGARSRAEIRQLLDKAAAFALPCRKDDAGDTDTMPLAILEAMIRGVPVVTTPIAGIPELIVNGQSGLLVSPQDPTELADALAQVIADPDLADRLGNGALEAAGRWDVRSNVDRLYREMSAASASRLRAM